MFRDKKLQNIVHVVFIAGNIINENMNMTDHTKKFLFANDIIWSI